MTWYNFSPAASDARALWQNALQQPQLYPRDVEFSELLQRVKVGLQRFCGSATDPLFLTSAGTGALECAIAALPDDSRLLVLRNGYFGDRLWQIARLHFCHVQSFDLAFGEPFTQAHAAAFRKDLIEQKANVVLGVHLETSSAVVNEVALLGDIAREHQAVTIIDGISSLGSEPCRLEDWGIDCFVASVYKAMLCPEGLSFLLANQRYLKTAQRKWSFYYDLARLEQVAKKNQYLWTPSVLSLQCLEDRLAKIEAEGYEPYFMRIKDLGAQFRADLQRMELSGLGEAHYQANCFTTIPLNEANAQAWLTRLKEDYRIIIGQGIGDSPEQFLRIGHYPHRTPNDMQRLTVALGEVRKMLRH